MATENAEKRRLQDLLRMYERREFKVETRKIKTESAEPLNPERSAEKRDMGKQPYFFPFGPGLPNTHLPPLQPLSNKKSSQVQSVQSLLG